MTDEYEEALPLDDELIWTYPISGWRMSTKTSYWWWRMNMKISYLWICVDEWVVWHYHGPPWNNQILSNLSKINMTCQEWDFNDSLCPSVPRQVVLFSFLRINLVDIMFFSWWESSRNEAPFLDFLLINLIVQGMPWSTFES